MSERTSVVDVSGNHEENILHWAKYLGTNKIRRKLFNAVYGRGTRPRSKKQLMQTARIPARDAQQAQNQLDHLAKYNLVVRVENDGGVEDGSRYLYRKDPSVRANRGRIIRYADNPAAADKVATKRRPMIRAMPVVKVVVPRQALRKREQLNVLYLTANPSRRHFLRIEEEVRRVQESIRGSAYRDNIFLHYRPAADLASLMDGLNDHRPRIVHFSGHGYEDGIAVDSSNNRRRPTRIVSFELLARALSATDEPPQIIVLNSCKSVGARRAFFPPAKIIVVMRESVSDLAAIAFATQFYAGIASGQSVNAAFAQGKVAVEAVALNEAETPDLLIAPGVDPARIVLT